MTAFRGFFLQVQKLSFKCKSCLAAGFVVLDNNQNKRNYFASESRHLQVKVGATNFAEKNHMIKNSVSFHFIENFRHLEY